MKKFLPLLLLLASCGGGASPNDWPDQTVSTHRVVNAADGRRDAIRVSYFTFLAQDRYIVLCSKSFTDRYGSGNADPFARVFTPAMCENVPDAHMRELVDGLVEAGVRELPDFDLATVTDASLQDRSFNSTVVSIQTDAFRKVAVIRGSERKSNVELARRANKIDVFVNTCANRYAIKVTTRVELGK